MKLLDLESVSNKIAKQLLIDGWTVEKLATTTAPILAKTKGIGIKTAGQIIIEAQELVSEVGLKESIQQSLQGLLPIQSVEKRMSPRVRRAKASKGKELNE